LFTNWVKKIHKLADRFPSIPSRNFILITGAIDGDVAYSKFCEKVGIINPISIIGGNFHEMFLRQSSKDILDKIPKYTVKLKNKKFLCFNKVARLHRILLVLKLLENGLINQAFYSFQGEHEHWIENSLRDSQLDVNEKRLLEKHRDKFPMMLNITDSRSNPVNIIEDDFEYFNESYFSLVNETLFFTESSGIPNAMAEHEPCLFFSEKIAKCFAMRHPFILAAVPGSLTSLKAQGYKTFEPWIDESYDRELDDKTRLELIIKEVQRLCSFTDEQWIEWQNNIQPIVEHNFEIFRNNRGTNVSNDVLKIFQTTV